MKLFGWDWDQWARGFAVIGIDEVTILKAVHVRREWIERYGSDSTESTIIGVKADMDYDSAYKLFSIMPRLVDKI